METLQLKNILEAALLSTDRPLKIPEIEALFAGDSDMPSRDEIRRVLLELDADYSGRGFELKEVASGYRLQVRQDYATWVGRLWEEKPARYTRALLETIALIAYRQPITRGEIEEVRGVSVSSSIIKTLLEREWIRVLGHKDVPGKPALYGTTKEFLDYFNLKSLDELPTLAEIKDLDQIHPELGFDEISETGDDQANDAEQADAAVMDQAEQPVDEAMDEPRDESKQASTAGASEGSVDESRADDEPAAPVKPADAAAETGMDEHHGTRDYADESTGPADDETRNPVAEAEQDLTEEDVADVDTAEEDMEAIDDSADKVRSLSGA